METTVPFLGTPAGLHLAISVSHFCRALVEKVLTSSGFATYWQIFSYMAFDGTLDDFSLTLFSKNDATAGCFLF